jgi:hypothetical protein
MGTDIYIFTEKRHDGEWHLVPMRLPEPRNYALFAMLAGVSRRWLEFDPIDVPRGVPEDASEGVRTAIESQRGEARCVSYVTFAELQAWDWHGKKSNGYSYWEIASDFLPQAFSSLASLGGPADGVRIVFHFDNAERNPWLDR